MPFKLQVNMGVRHMGVRQAALALGQEKETLDESVPATEKIVSLFEPHTDIVRKGGRETRYGHKINLATGQSGLNRPRTGPA